ncbi:hypothetical protein GCM10027286_22060 [Virgibacillus ainsalahensis]
MYMINNLDKANLHFKLKRIVLFFLYKRIPLSIPNDSGDVPWLGGDVWRDSGDAHWPSGDVCRDSGDAPWFGGDD